MVRILLVRPGSTDFDEQGRIKGTLDIPLSQAGSLQVTRIVQELRETKIDQVYSSPCRCAEQTAAILAGDHKLKVKKLTELQNLDHGLWHGKLIDEVRHSHPKVYRQLQEHPETVCPPEGEPLGVAFDRVKAALERLLKKHRAGIIAVVVPEPLFALVRSLLEDAEVGDLWKAECEEGGWCSIEVEATVDLTWRGAELSKT
ncbi:MAG: histidine phosphatase family protein [Planctomycetales bacterium]|nr:histidine phosphatase family protein [Planctomycetales bacterium]